MVVISAVIYSPWKLTEFISSVWLSWNFLFRAYEAKFMTVSNSCECLNSGNSRRNAGQSKLCSAGNCQDQEENRVLLWVFQESGGVSSGGILMMDCWWNPGSVTRYFVTLDKHFNFSMPQTVTHKRAVMLGFISYSCWQITWINL